MFGPILITLENTSQNTYKIYNYILPPFQN